MHINASGNRERQHTQLSLLSPCLFLCLPVYSLTVCSLLHLSLYFLIVSIYLNWPCPSSCVSLISPCLYSVYLPCPLLCFPHFPLSPMSTSICLVPSCVSLISPCLQCLFALSPPVFPSFPPVSNVYLPCPLLCFPHFPLSLMSICLVPSCVSLISPCLQCLFALSPPVFPSFPPVSSVYTSICLVPSCQFLLPQFSPWVSLSPAVTLVRTHCTLILEQNEIWVNGPEVIGLIYKCYAVMYVSHAIYRAFWHCAAGAIKHAIHFVGPLHNNSHVIVIR